MADERLRAANLSARADADWRDPAQVVSQWRDARRVDRRLLEWTAGGAWWDVLAARRLALLVTREYEHLLLAIRSDGEGPRLSYMVLPHPSGLAVDRAGGVVHVASTRNPNAVYDFLPATAAKPATPDRPLLPVRARFYPGGLYLHDLALVDGDLHANAVGLNAVVRLSPDGRYAPVWWPRCIDTARGPRLGPNFLQLNSIAAGADLASSFFSASTDRIGTRRPGHRNFPVDGHGVVFSGATRRPVARGLTRPHSARLWRGRLWVNNSGYGEVGVVEGGAFTAIARVPGWTRGLCFADGVAFVGSSRVLPRFRSYAPALDLRTSVCGVHAIDVRTGEVLGSLLWPAGNQVFAVECVPEGFAEGFPFPVGGRRSADRERRLFYGFRTALAGDP